MSTETLEIRQMARQFAQSDLRPHVEGWDRDGAISKDVIAQLAELGFLGMLQPEESGGMAFDMATYAAAIEEIAWGEPGVALLVAVANSTGTELSADARLAMVSDDAGGMFLVPTTSTGSRVATMGFCTVEIIRVDAEKRAEAGTAGLIGVAAISVGIAQAALDHARGYADEREQFSTRLREFEGIQFKLADMAIRTEAARTLVLKAAGDQDSASALPEMAKVFASETAMWVTTQAVQIFGGYGYMRDYPVEKLMRDAKATEMLEGANEALRVIIATKMYSAH